MTHHRSSPAEEIVEGDRIHTGIDDDTGRDDGLVIEIRRTGGTVVVVTDRGQVAFMPREVVQVVEP